MSMKEFEPTPPPSEGINPIMRYFSDLHFKGDSFIDMRIAIERMAEESDIPLAGEEMDALVGQMLPLYSDFEMNSDVLYDTFTVLPLVVLAPYIDANKNIRDVKKWYDSVLAHIRARARKVHDDGCYDSVSFSFNNACQHSTLCPLIYTAKHLEADLFETEFDSDKYNHDRLITFEVVQLKEKLAVERGFRSQTQANGMLTEYREAFWDKFHNPEDL